MSSIDILAIIERLHEEKKKNRIVPVHVTEIELISEMCREVIMILNHLVENGSITAFRTLNDKAYLVNK